MGIVCSKNLNPNGDIFMINIPYLALMYLDVSIIIVGLPQFIVVYSSIIYNYILVSIIIYCHLLSIISCYCQLLSTIIYYDPLLLILCLISIVIHYQILSMYIYIYILYVVIYIYILSYMIIHDHISLSIIMYYHI